MFSGLKLIASLISNKYQAFLSSFYCYFITFGNLNILATYVQNSPTKVESGHEFALHGSDYKKVLYHLNKTSKSYSNHVAYLYRLNGPLYTRKYVKQFLIIFFILLHFPF